MKTSRIVASLCAALSLSLAGCGGTEADLATTSGAIEVSVCLDAIATLRAQTEAVQYTNARDLAGLLAKLDAASSKLTGGKLGDAVQKLGDYQAKVQSLVAQGKIAASADGLVTPQTLVDGAAAAIACIQGS